MNPNAPTVDISLIDLLIALVLPLIVFTIIHVQKLKISRTYLYSIFRASIQLGALGYVIKWIFDIQSGIAVMAYLFLLVGIAAWIVLGRQKKAPKMFYPILGVAILAGSFISVAFTTQVVLKIHPWYNPRYLIPIAGMIIGNTMNASALSLERLRNDLSQTRKRVETLISLGADWKKAAEGPVNRALRAGLMPHILSMMSIGLVHLPGMLTGQLIAGNDPTQAVRYQLLVMFMLSAAVGTTALLTLHLSARRHFTKAHQLKGDMLG